MILLVCLMLSLGWPAVVITAGFYFLRRAWNIGPNEPLFNCWGCDRRKPLRRMQPGDTRFCKTCHLASGFVWRVNE